MNTFSAPRKRAQNLGEYAMVVALIAILALGALIVLGPTISGLLGDVNAQIGVTSGPTGGDGGDGNGGGNPEAFGLTVDSDSNAHGIANDGGDLSYYTAWNVQVSGDVAYPLTFTLTYEDESSETIVSSDPADEAAYWESIDPDNYYPGNDPAFGPFIFTSRSRLCVEGENGAVALSVTVTDANGQNATASDVQIFVCRAFEGYLTLVDQTFDAGADTSTFTVSHTVTSNGSGMFYGKGWFMETGEADGEGIESNFGTSDGTFTVDCAALDYSTQLRFLLRDSNGSDFPDTDLSLGFCPGHSGPPVQGDDPDDQD